MINVTDKIKKAYENSTTQIDKITINNKDYRITNVEYYDDCYLDGNIFGTAIGRMLEFEIENTIELEKAEVKYSTGLLIAGIEHWISLGNFIVESIEPNDTTGINKVVAMDYMLKTNIEYESKLDYSSNKITLLQVLQEVCTNSGLELATTSFANSNFIVDSNQFEEGTLNRQVIQAVAQISGTFAKIKSDNKLYLITPKRKGLLVKDVHVITVAELNALPVEKLSACDNEFNLNSYKELVIKRNTHPINLVSLGMSDIEGENIVLRDEDSISSNGENSLVINDNPFAYAQAKREQLITALFDCVKGFEYTAYEISGQSKPYLETGDEIVAIDKEGNLYYSFLFRFNFKSPKGLESEMSAPSITKATVAYQNVPSALEIAKKTEIRVNKQEQTIKGLISQQSETTEKLNQVEMTVDGTKETIKSVETKVDTAQSTADTATTKADNAQNTADTANTNAQNAQKTADENTTKITTTTTKVAEIEKNVEEVKVSVSQIESKVGENSIANGNFENDLTGWSKSTAGTTTGSVTVQEESETKYAQIVSKSDSTKLLQKITGLAKDIQYTLLFNAYDNGDLEIDVEGGVFQVDIVQYKLGSEEILEQITTPIYVTTENKPYTVQFTPEEDVDIEVIFTLDNPFVSNYTMSVMLSDVSLCSGAIAEQLAKLEMKSNKMNLEVGKKVNNEDFTGANIMLKINDDDSSEAQINADKININGTVSANGNFKVGTDGKMECTDATINGGNVTINDSSTSYGTSKLKIKGSDTKGYMSSTALEMYHDDFSSGVALAIDGIQGGNQIIAYSIDGSVGIGFGEIWADGNIYGANISSDKRLKENIAESDINAIEIIKKIGVKSFDWKNNKKHINAGYIAQEMEEIDENFVLKKPVTNKDGQVIDYKYYMNELPIVATLTKAIQEQQEIIESLQKQIKELKEGK